VLPAQPLDIVRSLIVAEGWAGLMHKVWHSRLLVAALVATGWAMAQTGGSDITVSTPDGRLAVLKADGTWSYAEAASAPSVQAELRLESRAPMPGGCQFQFNLRNRLPYEIRTLVPDFRVIRRGGTVYIEQNIGFGRVLPGDQQQRTLRVSGLDCAEIEKLQVIGGDRCDMGDLNKFTDGKGLCLARLQVQPSSLLTIEK
jgi:hypothetical protein